MPDEQNKCAALVLYEPQALTVSERLMARAERKRAELRESLERGEVAEPISLTAVLVSVAISASLSAASYFLQRAFAPKPKPIEQGRMSGTLVIQSGLGVMVNEIYGGDPGDGYGGVWVAPTVLWTSGIRLHRNVSRQQVGGGKGPHPQTQEVIDITYDMDLALLWGRGPLRLLKGKANNESIFDLYGAVSNYEGESSSNTFAGSHAFDTDNNDASGGQDVALNHNGSVQFNSVQSNGAATRQATFRYRTADNSTLSVEITTNGSAQTVSFTGTAGIFRDKTIALTLIDGANVIKVKNLDATHVLAIDRLYLFPGHTSDAAGTGIFDASVSADSDYDHEEPPDPQPDYLPPVSRFRGDGETDEFGAVSGTLLHGSNAQVTVNQGNDVQLPDPTMQAALDAQYGPNSTPAFRGKCWEMDTGFYLTRWQNAFPNRTGLLEHLVIKNISQLSAHFGDRVSIDSADYNFTYLADFALRGLRITGRRFKPSEPLGQCAQWFNVYYAEEEGVLVGRARSSVVVDEITDADVGWSESEGEDAILPPVNVTEPSETSIPRIFDVKYPSLDREGEAGLETDVRQIIDSEERQSLEVEITATSDEARAVAQRELYQADTEKPVKFSAPWTYLWWNVGNVVPVTLADGFSYQVELTKITGGIGVLECEGVLIDESLFTQPVNTNPGTFEPPPIPIPAMTIVALMDTPLLRDVDETLNNGAVFYACGVPRTNTGQAFPGFSLYRSKVGWERVADFTLPATMGKIVSYTALSSDAGSFDRVGEFIIDLYGTTATLESASEDDVLAGANPALFGDLVSQFADAERIGGHPNRWRVSTLLNGRRGTESHIADTFTNKRFVLLNEAVQAIPINLADLNIEYSYRAVTVGQSLDDAAATTFTWTGKSLHPLSISNPRGFRDSGGDLLIEFEGRSRVGGGIRSYQAGATNEEREIYKAQILNGGSTTLPNGRERILTIIPGMQQAAILLSSGNNFAGVTHNSLIPFPDARTARTYQEIHGPENFIEAGLRLYTPGASFVAFGLQQVGGTWKGLTVALLADQASGGIGSTLAADATIPYLVLFETFGPSLGPFNQRLRVYEYGSQIFSASSDSGAGDYDEAFGWSYPGTLTGFFRVRFNFVGSSVRIQKAHTANVPLVTIATGARAAEFPYFGVAANPGVNGEDEVSAVALTTFPFPKTIYAASQQVEDFGSAQSAIEMDIWQESAVVGSGEKTRVTL
jgi:hypothetical protein